MLRGCDVSVFQGSIDWEKAKEVLGLRFVYVKVAEGLAVRPDPRAAFNVDEARKAGLAVGGYAFLHVEADIPTQVALHQKHFLDVGLGAPGDLPPACDLESPEDPARWPALGLTGEIIRRRALLYLAGMQGWGNQIPLLYSYSSYWSEIGGPSEPAFSSYNLWAASYPGGSWPSGLQKPADFQPWPSWAFWQWSDKGKLPSGVTVDLDVFNGGEEELQAILKKAPLVNVATTDPAMPEGIDKA